MTDILNPIPHAVLSRVKWALGAVATFNDAIRQCRAIEAHTGSAGRYEWEYRKGVRLKLTLAIWSRLGFRRVFQTASRKQIGNLQNLR